MDAYHLTSRPFWHVLLVGFGRSTSKLHIMEVDTRSGEGIQPELFDAR